MTHPSTTKFNKHTKTFQRIDSGPFNGTHPQSSSVDKSYKATEKKKAFIFLIYKSTTQ